MQKQCNMVMGILFISNWRLAVNTLDCLVKFLPTYPAPHPVKQKFYCQHLQLLLPAWAARILVYIPKSLLEQDGNRGWRKAENISHKTGNFWSLQKNPHKQASSTLWLVMQVEMPAW